MEERAEPGKLLDLGGKREEEGYMHFIRLRRSIGMARIEAYYW